MKHLGDLAISAVCAVLAWGVYRLMGHPGWSLGFLAGCTVVFVWYRARQEPD